MIWKLFVWDLKDEAEYIIEEQGELNQKLSSRNWLLSVSCGRVLRNIMSIRNIGSIRCRITRRILAAVIIIRETSMLSVLITIITVREVIVIVIMCI